MTSELREESVVSAPDLDVLDTSEAGNAAIRGSALRTAGYVFGLVLSVVSAPLLIRHLGVIDFGQYVVVLSLITLTGGLTEAGLTAVGTREYVSRQGAERRELMRSVLGIRIALTLMGVAVATAFAALAGYRHALVFGTLLAGGGLLLQSTQNLLAVSLTGRLRFGWITAIDLLRQVTTVALIVALVLAGASLLPFFAISIPAGALALAITAVLVRDDTPLLPRFVTKTWMPLLKDTVSYAAATAVNVAYFRITIIALSLIGTALETGYFATSYRIIEVLIAIPGLLVSAVFPILARAAHSDRVRLNYAVQRVFEVTIIVGVWFALATDLSARFLIHLVAGDRSNPSITVLRIQALALIATFVAMGCGFALLSLRRHRELLIANLVALGCSVALTLALAPTYGAIGAAVATVIAEFGLALTTALLLVHPHTDVRLNAFIVVAAGLAAGAGAVTALAPMHEVIRVVAASVIYFGVLAALGTIPPEVRDALLPRRAAQRSS